MDADRERQLEAEIGKRDLIIRAFIRRSDAPRRGRKPSPLQGSMNVSRWPLTEFGMSAEGRKIDLPQTLQEIADTIGREGALRLAESLIRTRTGQRPRRFLYIPGQAFRPDHPVVVALGMEMALLLQDSWANCTIEMPKLGALQAAYREHVAKMMLARGEAVDDVVSQGITTKDGARKFCAILRNHALRNPPPVKASDADEDGGNDA